MFGIEVGYEKEGQSREFTIRTSIPTFAIDLKNNMHNRCPKCGENILYCDLVIEHYAEGTLEEHLVEENGEKRFYCNNCPNFADGLCKFSNYYGFMDGNDFINRPIKKDSKRHYHARCTEGETYSYRRQSIDIFNVHKRSFFAQIPEIEGIENLLNQ